MIIILFIIPLIFLSNSNYNVSGQSTTTTTDLILVDADSNTDIQTLVDGETINLNALSNNVNLNVRAEITGFTVGSVQFGYDDNPNFNLENNQPYTLFGDYSENFVSWTPTLGEHTIVVTTYSEADGEGTVTSQLNVTFYIIQEGSLLPTVQSTSVSPTITPSPTSYSSTRTWKSIEEEPDYRGNTDYEARHEFSFVQAGNKFYMFGGRENPRRLDTQDLSSRIWTKSAWVPKGFNHVQAVEYMGLLWVIGAFEGNGGYPNEIPESHVHVYDPANNKWIVGPEIPVGRRRGSAGVVVHNDNFYVVGGNYAGHNGGYVGWLDRYNPHTGEWEQLEDAPRGRDHFHAAVFGDDLFAIGGRQTGGDGGTFDSMLKEVDVYNFGSKSWSTLPSDLDLPTPRAGAATVVYNDKILVIGGEYNHTTQQSYKKVEAFDPFNENWTTMPSMTYPRHGIQAIVSGMGIYVTGGSPQKGGGRQKNMEVFGHDNASGEVSVAGTVSAPSEIMIEEGTTETFLLQHILGNQGVIVSSLVIVGLNAPYFSIANNRMKPFLIGVNAATDVMVNFSGGSTQQLIVADLLITHSGTKTLSVRLTGKPNTISTCIACTNERNDYMVDNDLECETWPWAHTNLCNSNNYWRQQKWCQHSCYIVGNGYDGDECCTDPPDPQQCTICTDTASEWMIDNGHDCKTFTHGIEKHCNKNIYWSGNKCCQLSCFESGNGYDGDACCTDEDTTRPTASQIVASVSTDSTSLPTTSHSEIPSSAPTGLSSGKPSSSPSGLPSKLSSSFPSPLPTSMQSSTPSREPSWEPTNWPTARRSSLPSSLPSTIPSIYPTIPPTLTDSSAPSYGPTGLSSDVPSLYPTVSPTKLPSSNPTDLPTFSKRPSQLPSATPSANPSSKPSIRPPEGYVLSKNRSFSTSNIIYSKPSGDMLYIKVWSDEVNAANMRKTEYEIKYDGSSIAKETPEAFNLVVDNLDYIYWETSINVTSFPSGEVIIHRIKLEDEDGKKYEVQDIPIYIEEPLPASQSLEGYVLSKNAGHSTNDMIYSRSSGDDTLHMRIWSHRVNAADMRKTEIEIKHDGDVLVKESPDAFNLVVNESQPYPYWEVSLNLTSFPLGELDIVKLKIEDEAGNKYEVRDIIIYLVP